MLKKAGFVVAAATAGLLAVSPLAFAGEYAGEHGGEHGGHHHSAGDNGGDHGHDHGGNGGGGRTSGCEFGDQSAENTIAQDAESGDSLSLIGAIAGDAPANDGEVTNSQSQAPVGSCNTVSDLVNISIEDNDDTSTVTDSGNTDIVSTLLGIAAL